MPASRRPGGRPPKTANPDAQVTIGLRVPGILRNRLEESARANHRNLSQEVERRIERSLDPEALFVDAINTMGPHRNPLGARAYVRTLMHAVYNPDDAETALVLLDALAFLRATAGTSTTVTVPKANIDTLKVAIRKIEAEARIGDGKP